MLARQLVEQVSREFRVAARRLLVTPIFTILAVVSLAVGLGVTTAIYSTVASLLWDTSAIRDPDQLAVVTQQDSGAPTSWRFAMSRSDFVDLRSRVRTVPEMAASSLASGALNDGTRTSTILAKAVTGNFFAIAELRVRFGRAIEPSDDRAAADPVVVLSHEFWRSKTGGDPGIVGRTVRLSGHPFVVVGIAAEGAGNGHDSREQLGVVGGDCWIPLASEALLRGTLMTGPDDRDLVVIARIPPAVPLRAVAAEFGGIGSALDRAEPGHDERASTGRDTRVWSVITAAQIQRGDASTNIAGAGVVLLVGLVLVVACTNIANLMLGRSVSRMPEFAVRRALGASRVRLIREQCAESVLLAVFSGIGAIVIANALCHLFTADVPNGQFRMLALRPTVDARALLTAGACLLVSLVVFGVVPAVYSTGAVLREGMAGTAAGAPSTRWRGRRHFIAWQVAISTALALIAFASARAVRDDDRYDVGIDVRHVVLGRVDFTPMHWDKARAARAHDALEFAARIQPGFESVAVSAGLPLGTNASSNLSVGDRKTTATDVSATPGVFATLRVPLVAGRSFDGRDTATTAPVIVLSQHVARDLFGGTNAVGQSLRYRSNQGESNEEEKTVEVIGVARDTDTTTFRHDRRRGVVYLPLAQQDRQSVYVLGRTSGNPSRMLSAIENIVRRAEPDLSVAGTTAVMALTPVSFVFDLVAGLSSAISILAVLIAMLGLYGVLSHVVARRTREIGVRVALGAPADRVRWMIVGDGLRPVAWGVVIGLVIGTGARLVLRATELGRDTPPIDPLAFTVVAIALVTAGLIACSVPARRASRVDPNVALREL